MLQKRPESFRKKHLSIRIEASTKAAGSRGACVSSPSLWPHEETVAKMQSKKCTEIFTSLSGGRRPVRAKNESCNTDRSTRVQTGHEAVARSSFWPGKDRRKHIRRILTWGPSFGLFINRPCQIMHHSVVSHHWRSPSASSRVAKTIRFSAMVWDGS